MPIQSSPGTPLRLPLGRRDGSHASAARSSRGLSVEACSVPPALLPDLYGDLYGEEGQAVPELDADPSSMESESEGERALFVKAHCLKGRGAHALSDSPCHGRISRANSSSAPGSPVSRPRVEPTWQHPGEYSRSEAGSPAEQRRFPEEGDDDAETEGPSVDLGRASCARPTPPHSPLRPAPSPTGVQHSALEHPPATHSRLRTKPSEAAAAAPMASAKLSRLGSRRHSVLIPDDSSSSSSTSLSTPRAAHSARGNGRRRSVDLARPERSVACEILFGGDDLGPRSPAASPRMLRKKTVDRPHRSRPAEPRGHPKSPLMAECVAKGSKSMGHSGKGEGGGRGGGRHPAGSPCASRSRRASCDLSSGSRSLSHDEAKESEAVRGLESLSILDGEGMESEDECRIDDFDPVDQYLPFLGIGAAVYDKIGRSRPQREAAM